MFFSFSDAVPVLEKITPIPPWKQTVPPMNLDDKMKKALQEKVYRLENELNSMEKELTKVKSREHNIRQKYYKLSGEYYKAKRQNNFSTLSKQKSKRITMAQKRAIVHKVLKPFFTANQIDCYLNQEVDKKTGEVKLYQRARKWSNEDLTLALTLKHLSPRAYRYLRAKKILPLPSAASIQQHFKSFQIQEGYFGSVDCLLRLMAKVMDKRDLVVALSLDEVHLKAATSYDSSNDKIVGPHSTANVLLMRGVFRKYKIPIWTKFDSDLEKEELFSIIQNLHAAGYTVVTFTSDMGPLNVRLFGKKGLNLTMNRPWFTVPANPEKNFPEMVIYYLFDVPHLLKLMRNHLFQL